MPKEKMRVKRNPLSQEQQDILKRLSKPETIEDVVLALRNPNSKIFQDMMNMMIANLDRELMAEKIIQHYLVQQYEADKQEREELMKQMIMSEITAQKFFQNFIPSPQIFAHEKMVQSLSEKELTEACNKRLKKIDELQNSIQSHYEVLETIKSLQQQNTQVWKEMAAQKQQEYETILEDRPLVDAQGRVIDREKTKEFIAALSGVSATASPVEIAKIIFSSYEAIEAASQVKTGKPPLPPSSPPIFSIKNTPPADYFAKMQEMNNTFEALRKLVEHEDVYTLNYSPNAELRPNQINVTADLDGLKYQFIGLDQKIHSSMISMDELRKSFLNEAASYGRIDLTSSQDQKNYEYEVTRIISKKTGIPLLQSQQLSAIINNNKEAFNACKTDSKNETQIYQQAINLNHQESDRVQFINQDKSELAKQQLFFDIEKRGFEKKTGHAFKENVSLRSDQKSEQNNNVSPSKRNNFKT